jgi:hypothetical protein
MSFLAAVTFRVFPTLYSNSSLKSTLTYVCALTPAFVCVWGGGGGGERESNQISWLISKLLDGLPVQLTLLHTIQAPHTFRMLTCSAPPSISSVKCVPPISDTP